ncbi:MAG: DNA repair protein RecN [Actinomycetota bacterium]|nr:DNA repair protein RecN [Actinomycetota bacterium]
MLIELSVTNLGVIGHVTLALPAGLIALTGETGAGKTLLVDAIDLLVGGRAHPGLVRPGCSEAVVDGRFELDGEEIVLTRVVPADGRSRAYINGRPATAGSLADLGAALVDLHGQHDHQSLLGVEAQREALDRFGRVDLTRLVRSRSALRTLESALQSIGGDARMRARELDLLRYQVDEIEAAGIADPDEDERLERAEDMLANAVDHVESAEAALSIVVDDDGVRDQLALAAARLHGRVPFRNVEQGLLTLLAELDDLADTLRSLADSIEPDPHALAEVQERRRLLHQFCRKYGETLADVISEREVLRTRLVELESHDERAAKLDSDLAAAAAELAAAEDEVGSARRAAAPALAAAIEAHLPALAMEKARVGVGVDGRDGGHVVYQLAANPGSPLQALSKVASGGELARTMLALRSVLSEAPPILVFDEVDAGIGGQAGFAVGRALAALADRHQVLVVTHLPQVAAFADAHLLVEKSQGQDDTLSEIRLLDDDARRTELARMLSGQPGSTTARKHAMELLSEARAQKESTPG